MLNFIGGLQTVLGLFTLQVASALIAHHATGQDATLPTPGPDTGMEVTLIVLGALIAAVAAWQMVKHLRFAGWQIFFGLAIVAASVILIVANRDTGYYYYSPGTYWLTYTGIVAGGLTILAVMAQFFLRGLRGEPDEI